MVGRSRLVVPVLATSIIAVGFAAGASGQGLQSRLDHKRHELRQARSRQVELSSAISRAGDDIDRLARQVSALEVREATVRHELAIKTSELHRAESRLARLRIRFRAARQALSERLVAIYESDPPDVMAVVLHAKGFDQIVSRADYLRSIQRRDNAIANRVHDLRNATRTTVDRLRSVRAALAAKRDELARTQARLRARQAALSTTRSRQQHALAHAKANGRRLQSDIADLQSRIKAQQAALEGLGLNTAGVGATPFPAGTPPPGQAVSPFPASEPLVWGRTDQGVDGTTAPGSPLLAMGSGTVSIEHDPYGFGASYPMLQTSFGAFYYGHSIPVVADGAHVASGQQMAMAHYGTWGNSTTPGGFEIGSWPPGSMIAGAAIRGWLIGLPRI